MLFGRERELGRIEEVLVAAGDGRPSALVVRGESGIGKSALLDAAAERAPGFRVLRASGVESEVELAFSGLHELLMPILPSLERLPAAQADALRGALGLAANGIADRLAAFVAALNLLGAAAAEEPLLCIVDDAQWLDDSSSAALAFAARRLASDPVGLLVAVRDPDVRTFEAPGVPVLQLGGLGRAASRALLAARHHDATHEVADHLVEASAGNPLALIELAAALTPGQRVGVESLDTAVGPKGFVELFMARLEPLPATTRRALVVVAASDTTQRSEIAKALETAGLRLSDLAPADRAGLVAVNPLVEFCHPLARSAVYRAASKAERAEAHRALAAAAAESREPDREAWHLAACAEAPDERVASALVAAAEEAFRRGGTRSQARALERAARLTPTGEVRAMRLAQAGDASYRAGRLEHADALFAEAIAAGLDVETRAWADARRAYLRVERGELDDALALMLRGADELETAHPRAAATLLTNAATVLYHRLRINEAAGVAERAWTLAGAEAMEDAELCHVVSFQRLLDGRVEEGMELARHCAGLVEDDPEGRIVVADAASTLLYGGDVDGARVLLRQAVRLNRAAGALGDLGYTLHMSAQGEWYAGHLERAYADQLEAVEIVSELGATQVLDDCLSRLATFEAVLGRDEDCRTHAQRALASAIRLGHRRNEVRARGALALLALGRGDASAAVDQLEPSVAALEAGGHRNPNHFRLHPDLVEGLARTGRDDAAATVARSLEDAARRSGIPWVRGAALRCRGLLAKDDREAEAAFLAALERHEGAGVFERARTALCFGEHLRRRGLRRQARIQLGAALDAFDAAGAAPWAERARTELHASGQRLQDGKASRQTLTPQELQVARLVAEGNSNRDVAAALFVTPKTVEFHLTRIYRKLEIHSRSELVRKLSGRVAS